jgi:formylglycine-generating enzyme required for sulfatase activity
MLLFCFAKKLSEGANMRHGNMEKRGFGSTVRLVPRLVALLLAAGGLALLPARQAAANALAVANVGLGQQDTNARTMNVIFDLSWSNSWRSADNWDAAWVFVKFRAPGSNAWEHAALSTNGTDHSPAAGGKIDAVSDGKGVFIYSSGNQTGGVNYARTRLRWNYGSNGYNFARGAVVEVSVQAIEMVYIPPGGYFLGSGGSEVSHFYQYTVSGQTTQPYLVLSETNPISVGAVRGNLYYDSSTYGGDRTGIISNAFPKGYAAFYCMKYEISQGQWVNFFNKLTASQKLGRDITDATGKNTDSELYRNTVAWTNAANDATCTAPDRACNFLSWGDGIACADWAGLRPLTELEYEKACRGAGNPVPNEYAWGSTNIVQLTSEAGTAGSGTETPQPTNANCCYNSAAGIQGPTRVGIFAVSNATRGSSGAGYYGVMELSGNLWERPVTVGTNAGRIFRGTHGDGVLASDGNATNNADWPSWSTGAGAGYRGGGWDNASGAARGSDRYYAAIAGASRYYNIGGRAARAAPSGVGP